MGLDSNANRRIQALDFIAAANSGVIATSRPDGSVRQSLIHFGVAEDRIVVSTVAGRAKVSDVRRSGWASLCVFGHERPYPSVTVEGSARILEEPADVGPLTRELARQVFGQAAPTFDDESLARAGRVVLELTPEHVYGASYLGASAAQQGGRNG